MRAGATPDSVVAACLSLAKDGTRAAIETVCDAASRYSDFESALRPLRVAVAPYDTVGPDYRDPSLGARRPSRLHTIEELPVALGMMVVAHGDFRHAVLGAVNYGRDCDSIATMAGAITGALGSEVPEYWAKAVAEASRLDLHAPARTLTEVTREVFARDVSRRRATRPRSPGSEAEVLRLTWVQPEDLLGHELRQAEQEGRATSAVAARWRRAGGPEAPLHAGASALPVSPYLRLLAEDLLDELADLPGTTADTEPTDLARIRALCPDWPSGTATGRYRPPDEARLEAAWLGRAVGCLLGKPVEKLPLEGIRRLAGATGNWPLDTWFTARGVPPELLEAYPWNRRSAGTSLAENIDGMPEDDDLNYPLLNLLLLGRHGRSFTTADVARLWLEELPAGRTFTAERIAYRNLLCGIEPPRTARHRNPFREWIGALIRADVHGWTNPGDPAAAAEQAHRDATLTHTANGVYAAMFTAAAIASAPPAPTTSTTACVPDSPSSRPVRVSPAPSGTPCGSPGTRRTSTRSSTGSMPPTAPATGCTPSPTRL